MTFKYETYGKWPLCVLVPSASPGPGRPASFTPAKSLCLSAGGMGTWQSVGKFCAQGQQRWGAQTPSHPTLRRRSPSPAPWSLITRLKTQTVVGLAETPVGTNGCSSHIHGSSRNHRPEQRCSPTKPAARLMLAQGVIRPLAQRVGARCGERNTSIPCNASPSRLSVRARTPCSGGTVLHSCSSVSKLCHIFGILFPTRSSKLFLEWLRGNSAGPCAWSLLICPQGWHAAQRAHLTAEQVLGLPFGCHVIWPQLAFLGNSPSSSLPLTAHWFPACLALSSASVTLSSVPLVSTTSCLRLLGSSSTLQVTWKHHVPRKAFWFGSLGDV